MWASKIKALTIVVSVIMSMSSTVCAQYDTLSVLDDTKEVGAYAIIETRWTGRAQQGIAADEEKFYTSVGAGVPLLNAEKRLYRYDPTWGQDNIQVTKRVVYATGNPQLVHLGDIDVYNGYVYGPLTDSHPYNLGDVERIEIAWFDAETLEYEDHIDMSSIIPPDWHLDDISGLAFKDDQLYILGYETDGTSYGRIFVRNMNGNVPGDFATGSAIDTYHANGLAFNGDYMFVSWGPLDPPNRAYISIYKLPLGTLATPIKTYQYETKDGHAEGITFNRDELWVAQNRYVLELENPLPDAPTGVSASDAAYTERVRVSWNTVSDASGYEIYRNTSNNPSTATRIGTNDDGMNNLFNDFSVGDGKPYYYWVKASKDVGGTENLLSEFGAYDSGRTISPSASVTRIPSADAYINQSSPGTNYGSYDFLFAVASNSAATMISLLKFDLSSIPRGSTISAAELEMILQIPGQDPDAGVNLSVYEGDDWTESGITWNNASFSNAPIGTINRGSAATWIWRSSEFPDLISVIDKMINDPEDFSTWRGFTLRGSSYVDGRVFHSKEASNSVLRPKLTVYYTEPAPCTISGYVRTSGGTGISGVTMSGWPETDPVTDDNGYYSGTVDYYWSGTITPSKTGYTFSDSSKSYSDITEDRSNENYTGIPITPTISGYVRASSGPGISGVTMAGWPGADPVTDDSGYYSGTVSHDWSGTITPSQTGYTFDPTSKSYSNVTLDKSDENYTGTQAEIAVDPTSFAYLYIFPGSAGEDSFELWNSAGGTPAFTITVEPLGDPVFLTCNPNSGALTSEHQTITFTWDATLWCEGRKENLIRIDAPGATNSPRYIRVTHDMIRIGYPVANDDSVTVKESSTNNLINVLANDSEPHGLLLTVSEVTPAAHGTVELIEGQVFYTPEADYLGSDSFTYTVDDGRCGTDSATVNITVAATPVEIWVDDDYDTTTVGWGYDHFAKIQDALDIAYNGVTEEITVYPGIYYENVDFKGKQVTLRSTDPNDPDVVADTIIDGNNMGTVVSFVSSENELSILSGFTIQNGYAENHGGGIKVLWNLASPVIEKNAIMNNAADWSGGGMYAFLAKPILRDNVFLDNSAVHWGGAIYLRQSELTSSEDTFVRNRAHSGGGVYLVLADPDNESVGASASLANSLFVSNHAEAWGGGVSAWDGASVLLNNCVFANNEASAFGGGGGVHFDGSIGEVVSCTFYANTTNDFSGAGIDTWLDSNVSIVNTVIAYSTRGHGIHNEDDSQVSVRYSNVFGNPAGNYYGLPNPTGENGCISTDPLFVNRGYWDPNGTPDDTTDDFWIDGNYNLQPGSPCIDAADGDVAPATDILGNRRYNDLDTPNTGTGTPNYVDIGAYEFQGTSPSLIGDFCGVNFGPPDGYVDVWDLMQFSDHWHTRRGEGNWNPGFDLAGPNFGDADDYVDVWDLMVFADHWHEGEKP